MPCKTELGIKLVLGNYPKDNNWLWDHLGEWKYGRINSMANYIKILAFQILIFYIWLI